MIKIAVGQLLLCRFSCKLHDTGIPLHLHMCHAVLALPQIVRSKLTHICTLWQRHQIMDGHSAALKLLIRRHVEIVAEHIISEHDIDQRRTGRIEQELLLMHEYTADIQTKDDLH